jgi:hypothetical protein
MPDLDSTAGLTPVRVNVSPGRKVLHVVTARVDGRDVELRYAYEVVGIATDYQTSALRVVCRGEGGALRVFPLDLFERGFIPREGGTEDA